MLGTLVARAGEVATKDELFRAAWVDTAVSDAALTSCIEELWQALREERARNWRYIQTLHRIGFRFLLRPESGVCSRPQVRLQRLEFNTRHCDIDGRSRLCALQLPRRPFSCSAAGAEAGRRSSPVRRASESLLSLTRSLFDSVYRSPWCACCADRIERQGCW